MKVIDIRNQPRIGLGRILNLTFHGIRYRLFRSLVTVAVIAVAVAFLMNILGESLVKQGVAKSVMARVSQLRQASRWASRLSLAGSPEEILRNVAANAPDSPRAIENRRLGGFADEAAYEAFRADAKLAMDCLAFLETLRFNQRRRLVHRADGIAFFTALEKPANWEAFQAELASMKSIRWPVPEEAFKAFIDRWPAVLAQADKLREGRLEAIESVRRDVAAHADWGADNRSSMALLTAADHGLDEILRKAGFQFDPATAGTVAEQARSELDRRFLEESLVDPALQMRKPLAAKLDVLPKEVRPATLWGFLAKEGDAAWFLGELGNRLDKHPELKPQLDRKGYAFERLKPAYVRKLAAGWEEMVKLENASRTTSEVGGGWLGMGERMSWLILVSLVVCTVGIANAMLMAVTERFREIATLKCLGALDSFIMFMFVLEACMLGAVGGIMGALMGLVLACLRMLVTYGSLLGGALPIGRLLLAALASLVMGVLLAGIAAVYPSLKAARLAPMEAMRIE